MLARFFDKLITLAGVYLLVLIWAGYFLPREDRLFVSFVIAVAITGLLFLFVKRKKKAEGQLTKLQLEHMEEVMGQFAFSDPAHNIKFFAETLGKVYSTTAYTNYLTVTHSERTTIVFPFMRLIKLTMADLSEMYASVTTIHPKSPILILTIEGATKSAEDTALALAERKVTILSKTEVYKTLGELESYPPITVVIKKKNRRKISEVFAGALSPKLARRYLMIAGFMLLTSFFVPMSIYYILFASFVTVLAIACKLNVTELLKSKSK
ncbi:MAG: hypothetical protein FWC80_03100 [Firmicutes bacterium]|nr:hypothetical protein [Bacillota bacterium]